MLWHTARETWCEITISMSDFPFSIFDWKSMVLCRVHCARRRKFFFSNHLTALQCINSLKLLHMLLVPTEAHFNAMRRLTIRSVLFDLGMMRSTLSLSPVYTNSKAEQHQFFSLCDSRHCSSSILMHHIFALLRWHLFNYLSSMRCDALRFCCFLKIALYRLNSWLVGCGFFFVSTLLKRRRNRFLCSWRCQFKFLNKIKSCERLDDAHLMKNSHSSWHFNNGK